ncbi:hypothetical protein BST13_06135 [Mycobacterium aquaticum]|uniref:DUF4407 domain-containing protein n=1 Tax=Mycobacterium aquaticum TaxID=1927124 RepID=A0A1X0B7I1_9MYCO|nr:hypothetical protein BST13_06135 [Mycobacterium aquaticum]
MLGTVLATLAVIGALAGATRWPTVAVIGVGLVVGVVFGVASWAVSSGRSAVIGRWAVAVAVGAVIGELAAMVVFGGSIDRVLAEQASAAPTVTAAAGEVDQARAARTKLDDAVTQAAQRRDEALVVARCEFNPSPQCPQVRITGVPGVGPETRTADDFLADTQRELDTAVADRDGRAAGLDAQISAGERTLAQAREAATAGGVGARWLAMNSYTLGHPGALALRLLVVGFFVLLSALPLILRLWRGETTPERADDARAEQERAELDADTAVAVKRAQVRATIDEMWAEQELTRTQLAIEAQNEIDREQQRRRVIAALDAPMPEPLQAQEPPRPVTAHRPVEEPRPELIEAEPVDLYLPIAAAAEAASFAAQAKEPDNLPAPAQAGQLDTPAEDAQPKRGPALPGIPNIPVIPDVTKAAVRWLRPFVPPIVAGAIDNATKPIRQVFEETEEIHLTVKRTHKVTVETEAQPTATPAPTVTSEPSAGSWPTHVPSGRIESQRGSALRGRHERGQLSDSSGPRQLPPA